MTRPEAKNLLFKLVQQVDKGFKRIQELEKDNKHGFEHTIMREQINATLETIEWLRESLPHPFVPNDFNTYIQMKNNYKFSWLGWL